MNVSDDPRHAATFVLGTTVVLPRSERRTAPPTEIDLIRAELRKLAEARSRRRGLLDRLRFGRGRA